MAGRDLHLKDLFEQFARVQQNRLINGEPQDNGSVSDELYALLHRYPDKSDRSLLQVALLDPYFPLGMLEQTLFADVDGMRFFVNKRRPDLEPVLQKEFRQWSAAFLRIRMDIQAYFDPETITCIPIDSRKHQLPTDQWCTLCGVCCQIGGVPPAAPAGIHYPDDWPTYLAGGAVDNQQLCPFLFQYFGEPCFFCAIHHVKPIACREFDEQNCCDRLSGRNLHSR